MHTMGNAVDEKAVDLRLIQRLRRSSFVPASEDPAVHRGVATRDIVIDRGTGVSARLFLPSSAAATGRRLPIVVYFHGGSFFSESAFSRTYHRYAASLAASTAALVVSVEYRLAPQYPVPAAYDDAWAALRWAASLADPWLAGHADPRRIFLAGDSAGGNIAYHTAVRASREDGNIEGLVMVQPFFWGAERLPSEAAWDGAGMYAPELVDTVWPFVTAGRAGNDDRRLNPPEEEIASLKCRRAMVAVSEKDVLRDRGRLFAARMRDCAWNAGDVTLLELEGEDHGFHLYSPLRATSKKLMQSIVQFINHSTTSPSPTTVLPQQQQRTVLRSIQANLIQAEGKKTKTYWALGVPTRPFYLVLSNTNAGDYNFMSRSTSLKIGRANPLSKTSYSLVSALLPSRAYKNSFLDVRGSYVMKITL